MISRSKPDEANPFVGSNDRMQMLAANRIVATRPFGYLNIALTANLVLLTLSILVTWTIDPMADRYRFRTVFWTFSLDSERNIPTFFSLSQLAFASML